MLGAAIIIFREVLEAALVLSIVAAATKMVEGRNRALAAGVAAGVCGAILVAIFAGQIENAVEGIGQELFNAGVLFIAVAMLGWHNIWMQRHGRELAARMSSVGAAVAAGARPLTAVAIAVGLAVLREGSEAVLFLFGIASGGASPADIAMGGLLGILAGAATGLALYAGLLRLSTRYLFGATSWLILLLAAGMAATGAKYLAQADILPSLGNRIWDTSWLLSEDSIPGQLAHILIGYVAMPSGIQLAFYLATIVIIGGAMLLLNRAKPQISLSPAATLAAASLIIVGPLTVRDAHAGFKVYSPNIEYGELEIEYSPVVTIDGDPAKDNAQKHPVGVGYAVNDWWFTEVYAAWEREAGTGERTSFTAFEWENRFQLTNPGELWADLGLLVEYERTDSSHTPDELAVSLLAAKDIGKFTATYNLELAREIGGGAPDDVALAHRFQLKYRLDRQFEPAIEIFGEFGPIDAMPGFNRQEHYVGPVATGAFELGDSGAKLKYNTGYLFGVSDAAADGVFKAIVELEIPL